MIDPTTVVAISTLLFCAGVYGLLRRKNAIVVLMSIEIMLNAANINFIAFSGFHGDSRGQVFALISIVLAAAEVAVGLAILLVVYRHYQTSNVDAPSFLRW